MRPDLETTYLGLPLRSPIIASASPLTGDLDSLRALEREGIAAVVLPSLFEEQIEHEQIDLHDLLEHQTHSFGEAVTWFPELDDYNTGPDSYLEHLAAAKAALDVPVIASLNGVSRGGWLRYARLCQEAGADALELNVYAVETDPGHSAAEVEERTLALVRDVREAVTIPLAVKVGPFYSAFAHMAGRLSDGRRGRARALQPLPPAGHRPRDAGGRALAAALDAGRAPPAASLDRDPPRGVSTSTSPGRRACTTGRAR